MGVEYLTILTINQWKKIGDHPNDNSKILLDEFNKKYLSEGAIVRHFRHPKMRGGTVCPLCNDILQHHGLIDIVTGEGLHWKVCPGDYIIGTNGEARTPEEYFPVKNLDILFAGTSIKLDDVVSLFEKGSNHWSTQSDYSKAQEKK